MLGQTRADVQVTSLLRDLSLSVLLYGRNRSIRKGRQQQTIRNRQQLQQYCNSNKKTRIAAETETVAATIQRQPK